MAGAPQARSRLTELSDYGRLADVSKELPVRARRLLLIIAVLATGCSAGAEPGTFTLPGGQVGEHATAYIATVVADPAGDDLEPGAGEHVVIRSNFDHRTDMGGWAIEDADGNRLPLGIGRQLDPDAELRVYSSCGEDTDAAVFACLDEPVLDDDGDVVRLLDSGGNEVMRFAYGAAAD